MAKTSNEPARSWINKLSDSCKNGDDAYITTCLRQRALSTRQLRTFFVLAVSHRKPSAVRALLDGSTAQLSKDELTVGVYYTVHAGTRRVGDYATVSTLLRHGADWTEVKRMFRRPITSRKDAVKAVTAKLVKHELR